MWGRDYAQANADAFAAVINAEVFITGHEPCPRGYQAPNTRQVIIDCCNEPACYALVPLDAQLSSADDVLKHVKFLHNSTEVLNTSAADSNGSPQADDGKTTSRVRD